MSEASRTFDQLTFEDLDSAISSPASGCGATPSDAPDGPTTARYGLDHAHANLSARQAKEMGLTTSGISGPPSTTLSGTTARIRSWANRLRERTGLLGSTLYTLTWKRTATPSGRSIYALRASVRRTSGKGFTGVPTPRTNDDNLSRFENPEQSSLKEMARENSGANLAITAQAMFTGVPTPKNQNANSPGEHGQGGKALQTECATAIGETPNGSCAETGSTGQLNPCYSRFLMGLPVDWDYAAFRASETIKARKSSTRSSKKARQGPQGSGDMETPFVPKSPEPSSKPRRESDMGDAA